MLHRHLNSVIEFTTDISYETQLVFECPQREQARQHHGTPTAEDEHGGLRCTEITRVNVVVNSNDLEIRGAAITPLVAKRDLPTKTHTGGRPYTDLRAIVIAQVTAR